MMEKSWKKYDNRFSYIFPMIFLIKTSMTRSKISPREASPVSVILSVTGIHTPLSLAPDQKSSAIHGSVFFYGLLK